jgi:hypothetical protein
MSLTFIAGENLLSKVEQQYYRLDKRRPNWMKRARFVAFLIAGIFFLAICAGTVSAPLAGYSITVYKASTTPTIDGKWTTETEWDDAATGIISDDAIFRIKWNQADQVYDNFIVEFFSDNTNDAEDDVRVDYVGHGASAQVNTYVGGGIGWGSGLLTGITVEDSLDVSKLHGSPHWITEFKIAKDENGIDVNNAIRVSVYDASNSSAGEIAWPPTGLEQPVDWGDAPQSSSEIPEGIGLFTLVIIMSVAVLVGSLCGRKRSKLGKLTHSS